MLRLETPTLIFVDRPREAARLLLALSSLNDLRQRGWLTVDDGHALVVDITDDHRAMLSRGETILLDLLGSFAGGRVDLSEACGWLDDRNRAAAAMAVSCLLGFEARTLGVAS